MRIDVFQFGVPAHQLHGAELNTVGRESRLAMVRRLL